VRLGEVLRARVAQSKRRNAPIVSRHHQQPRKSIRSSAYRRDSAADLRHGECPDESGRHHQGTPRSIETRRDHREHHSMPDWMRLGCVSSWEIAAESWYHAHMISNLEEKRDHLATRSFKIITEGIIAETFLKKGNVARISISSRPISKAEILGHGRL